MPWSELVADSKNTMVDEDDIPMLVEVRDDSENSTFNKTQNQDLSATKVPLTIVTGIFTCVCYGHFLNECRYLQDT